MAFIEWQDSYSVGVNIIDTQHKRLIKIINELHEALQESRSKESLGEILQNLINFVLQYFKTEEELMVKEVFEEYTLHRYEHEKLTDEMKRLHDNYLAGNIRINTQLMNYFRDW